MSPKNITCGDHAPMMGKRGVASAHVPKAVYYATIYEQGSAELLSSAVHILGVSINIPQAEADVKTFLARFSVILSICPLPYDNSVW